MQSIFASGGIGNNMVKIPYANCESAGAGVGCCATGSSNRYASLCVACGCSSKRVGGIQIIMMRHKVISSIGASMRIVQYDHVCTDTANYFVSHHNYLN